jgi:hypothetical protein
MNISFSNAFGLLLPENEGDRDSAPRRGSGHSKSSNCVSASQSAIENQGQEYVMTTPMDDTLSAEDDRQDTRRNRARSTK